MNRAPTTHARTRAPLGLWTLAALAGWGAMGAALLVLAAAMIAVALPAASKAEVRLKPLPLDIADEKLFDLGVADYDRDGRLDLFTTNHSRRQSLLRNRGGGRFRERIHSSGFHNAGDFPGLEDQSNLPDTSAEGVYIFTRRDGRYQILRSGQVASGPITGTLELITTLLIERRVGVTATFERDEAADPAVTRIRLTLQRPGSTLVVKPGFVDLPIEAEIDSPVPVGRIFVGSQRLNPQSHRFTLRLRDRHGVAWADLNRDGRSDVFVVGGGQKGRIERYGGVAQDELMMRSGERFTNQIEASGIRKGACRGRAAQSVDYDGDGRLDLFSSCEGTEPMLWRQRPDGSFAEVSDLLPEGQRVIGNQYRWVDLTGDLRAELLVARKPRIEVYRFRSPQGPFDRAYSVRRPSSGVVKSLAVADYDNDGDADVFAGSPRQSSLLVNRDGELDGVDPARVGLPLRAVAAAWVDHDNDGLTDLHAVPGGIYRQKSNGRFAPTGLARASRARGHARVTWFDADNDGNRDLLLAFKRGDRLKRATRLLRSRGARGHWLAVDLTGSPGNTEAIGARVTVRAGKKRLTGWVGESETSRHSQGHYRVYFGLGERVRARLVSVAWPDGTRTTRRDVRADQVLSLERPVLAAAATTARASDAWGDWLGRALAAGAGVALGLLIPRLRRRRRSASAANAERDRR